MYKKCALALALALPCAAQAIELGKGLMCEISAADFFQPLVQRRIIDINPYVVEDSVNYFHPTNRQLIMKKADRLLAFDMKVNAVFGYARDQVMFRRGPGTEPPNIFGVIVNESIGNVQAQLSNVGAYKAKTRRVTSNTTEIFCEDI
jgi:hypothetical protein